MDNTAKNNFFYSHSKFFNSSRYPLIEDMLKNSDDKSISKLYQNSYNDPLMVLLISIFAGTLGIDRIIIGDTLLGILKLVTCGGFGIWYLIDIFLIMDATRDKNFEKFNHAFRF